MDFQHYPTPFALAQKAWGKFQNKEVSRLLEPSAGRGDLLKAAPRHLNRFNVDVCEIDLSMHNDLRENVSDVHGVSSVSVVGFDFLALNQGAMYSHILMNPPFVNGVEHLLHAWNLAWECEIVCFLNAESLRNPYSSERRRLSELIHLYGSVEFIENGFSDVDATRKTNVEVALVWLKKTSEVGSFVVADILGNLSKDVKPEDDAPFEQYDLAIPSTVIENYVAMFDLAVGAARESVKNQARYEFMRSRLGKSMAELTCAEVGGNESSSSRNATGLFSAAYQDLKDRAWTNILNTADFTSKLSSGAQKKIREEFQTIKQMQFTTANVHGFLRGILESQGEIQNDMVCEVFDMITRYHSDNICYYRGWKSNDRHRTFGMRLKTTRFVIPRRGDRYFRNSVSYETQQMMADIDKVFHMLEGKEAKLSLSWIFNTQMDALCRGERVSGSIFDIRYYPGVGTVHFFPKRADLMDRLNRIVGKQRQWLPPNVNDVSGRFWQQFDRAESLDKKARAKGVDSIMNRFNWMNITESQIACDKVDKLMKEVHEEAGIPDFALDFSPKPADNEQLLLLAA